MRNPHFVGLFAAGAFGLGHDAAAQQVIWQIEANDFVDRLSNVSVGPDITGDGVAELLLGYVDEACGSGSYGVVRLFSTNLGQLQQWCGEDTNFGAPVGWLDDIDGRGVADIVICEQGYNEPSKGANTGRIQVYSGEDATLLYEVIGTLPYGYFGRFDVLGDVDGDGLRDLILGSDSYGPNFEGQAWILSGATGTQIRTHLGTSLDEGFGQLVRGLGDVDGDGVHDYGIYRSRVNKGGLDVHSGQTGALIFRKDGGGGENFAIWFGPCSDQDGDGLADVLVSRLISSFNPGDGRVDAYSPISGTLIWSVAGISKKEYYARPTVEVADQNADGISDFLFATRYDDHDGRDSGRVDLISGATLRPLFRFYPNATGVNGFGETLTLGADFNGDGIEDLVMGCGDGGSLSNDAGIVQIRAGNDLWLQADPIDPVTGETVTVDLRGAASGRLGLIALVSIDGVPTFDTLLLAPFDTNGELQFCADIDSSLSGMEFTLMGYAQKSSGRGRLLDATPFVVTVQ